MDIGKSTRVAQSKFDMKNYELAKHLGVQPFRVCTIRKNKKASSDVIERLSNVFGVPVSEFISWGE